MPPASLAALRDEARRARSVRARDDGARLVRRQGRGRRADGCHIRQARCGRVRVPPRQACLTGSWSARRLAPCTSDAQQQRLLAHSPRVTAATCRRHSLPASPAIPRGTSCPLPPTSRLLSAQGRRHLARRSVRAVVRALQVVRARGQGGREGAEGRRAHRRRRWHRGDGCRAEARRQGIPHVRHVRRRQEQPAAVQRRPRC